MSLKKSRGSRACSLPVRRVLFGLVGAAALISAVAFNSVAAVAASSAQKASPSGHAVFRTVVMSTDVLNGLKGAKNLGATPASTSVEVGLTLANPHAAAQNAAYHTIYDPTSPLYHHFLTAAQVAADFGVPNSTFQRLKAWPRGTGSRSSSPLIRTSTCS